MKWRVTTLILLLGTFCIFIFSGCQEASIGGETIDQPTIVSQEPTQEQVSIVEATSTATNVPLLTNTPLATNTPIPPSSTPPHLHHRPHRQPHYQQRLPSKQIFSWHIKLRL